MGEILFGGREAIERAPVSISLINVNSPLRYDDRMLGAMFEYVKADQAVVITPFLLMGAMSPVSLPATLVQQIAEALAGIALAQLIRPGCPGGLRLVSCRNTDMQSGSPRFGTPESAIGVLCTGQIARRFGLPWRGGGGLNASQTVDAQAAYESLMTLLPTFLAGTNFVMHSAGWLEGGLVSCYEKFIVDIELLRELRHEFTPLEIDEAASPSARTRRSAPAATSSAPRTRSSASASASTARCCPRPRTSTAGREGRRRDTTARAGEIWRATLESYEQPPIDDAIRAELEEFVVRRRAELGD